MKKTVKIYKAFPEETEYGMAVRVLVAEAEEKPKTYTLVGGDFAYERSVHKNDIGKTNYHYCVGYGLTKEQALDAYKRSVEVKIAQHERLVQSFKEKLAAPVVYGKDKDGDEE